MKIELEYSHVCFLLSRLFCDSVYNRVIKIQFIWKTHEKMKKNNILKVLKKFPMFGIAPAILLPANMPRHNVQTEVELFITSPEA